MLGLKPVPQRQFLNADFRDITSAHLVCHGLQDEKSSVFRARFALLGNGFAIVESLCDAVNATLGNTCIKQERLQKGAARRTTSSTSKRTQGLCISTQGVSEAGRQAGQILESSFSAVSEPNIATKNSVFNVFS